MKKGYYIIIAIIIYIGANTYLIYNLINNKENKYQEIEENNSNMKILVDNMEVAFIPEQGSGYIFDSVECDKESSNVWFDYKNWKVHLNARKTVKCTLKFKKGQLSDIETKFLNNNEVVYDDFGNLRYIGATPNNYVWFNCKSYSGLTTSNAQDSDHLCEKWRIIGLMNSIETKNKGKQKLIKIIRDEPLPRTAEDTVKTLSWDGKNYNESNAYFQQYNNDWTTSELMYLLNEGYDEHKAKTSTSGTEQLANNSLYWNSGSGKCYTSSTSLSNCDFSTTGLKEGTTKNMIESVKWNLGGLSTSLFDPSCESGNGTSQWYSFERGTETYCTWRTCDGFTIPTYWIGEVGLVYPSDYGYATKGGTKYDRQACLDHSVRYWDNKEYKTDCAQSSWLYNGHKQFTLTPNSDLTTASSGVQNATYIHIINTDGDVDYSSAVANQVRPTLYLTSTTKISTTVGDGSADNPYILVP